MTAAPLVYQLEVTLQHIKPAIWRRLLVSGDTTLAALHVILQVAMGWEDAHVHAFVIHGQRFGMPSPDDYVPVVDERKHCLAARVFKGHRFQYEYDFGDGWEHEIVVEDVRAPAGETVPSCIDGRRACPPEDCGGPPGYADLCNPRSARHKELLEWLGAPFDAALFELDDVNAALAALARPRRARAKRKLH